MTLSAILDSTKNYYDEKLRAHGPTPKGVDWNSHESQTLRFEKLLKIHESLSPFSINDYGCGYGALIEYMTERGYTFRYYGFDISEKMIASAEALYGKRSACRFFSNEPSLPISDYTVASGIFNVKLETSTKEWEAYTLNTLNKIAGISQKGFAFNILTTYSDEGRRRPDLYYGDPLFYFGYCKGHFSPHVALLHDYPLYEFTILVRKPTEE